MGWINELQVLLDAKTDEELGVRTKPAAPEQCNMRQIDLELALQLVLEHAGDWKLRTSLSDAQGIPPTTKQVRRIRALEAAEKQRRSRALNQPEEPVI